MRRISVVAIFAAFLLTACLTRHRDVLVFGTDTTFGVGVGADPANTQLANFTIGYKRREAVWMPLLVNGGDSVALCKTAASTPPATSCDAYAKPPEQWNPKYESSAKGVDSAKGGKEGESDTYSVFASFGGNASGGGSGASAAVAQFFATGIAAQRLGSNPAAAQLVSTKAADPEAEKAKGAAEVYKAYNFKSQQELDDAKKSGAVLVARRSDRLNQIVEFVWRGADDTAKKANAEAIIAGVPGLAVDTQSALRNHATDREKLKDELNDAADGDLPKMATWVSTQPK